MKSWLLGRQDSMEAGLLPQAKWDSVTSLRYAANIDRRLASRLGEGCPDVRSGVYTSFRRGPHLADLAAIQAPVLLVHGTRPNSTGDGAAALVRVLPSPVLVTLMGAGHDPWYERPEQFFAHVQRFMESVIGHASRGRGAHED
jgi:pimeloyl-ACP methyl ester carboxylesterase